MKIAAVGLVFETAAFVAATQKPKLGKWMISSPIKFGDENLAISVN